MRLRAGRRRASARRVRTPPGCVGQRRRTTRARARSSARPRGHRRAGHPRAPSRRRRRRPGPARGAAACRTWTRPSNSPAVANSSHQKSTWPSSTPPTERTGCWSSGAGSPARWIASLLRVSPGLIAPGRAKASTCRAVWLPGRPDARSSASSSDARVTRWVCSAASAGTSPRSNGRVRARSTSVRGIDVTASPSTATTSSGSSAAACRWTTPLTRAPDRRARVAWTRAGGAPSSGSRCSTAAEPWLITAPGPRQAYAACTARRWDRTASRAASSTTYAPGRTAVIRPPRRSSRSS